MFIVTMEGLMIKFMVLAMTSVDDWIVIGLAVVDLSGRLMDQLLRVYAPAVHRGTFVRYIVGGGGNDRIRNGYCWMGLMIVVVVVARVIVVSEGVLLAV